MLSSLTGNRTQDVATRMLPMSVFWRLLTLTLCAAVLATAMACQSSGYGIVYVSEVDGDAEIYLVDPESGESAPVERLPSSTESGPRWSPDGKYVAFVSGQPDNLDIRVVSVDTEDAPRNLTSSESNEESPRWNADGEQVAYVTDIDGHSDVYVTPLEGGSPVRITSGDTEEFLGDWSPDGHWLVFTRRGNEESRGLWLRNPAGVNLFRLTSEDDLGPVWSPDGDAIAFVRNTDGNRDIYLLLPEDDDDWRGPVKAQPLITSPAADYSPAWAPDGDTLVYVSERDGNPEIYTLETDKQDPPQRLTTNEASESQPVWSPDGKRIAFVSDLHGQGEIFAMDADGTNQQRLTHSDAQDHSPDW